MTAPSVILEQSKPAATTPTTLYTVPADRRARFYLYAVNNSAGNNDMKVWVVKSGESRDDAVNLIVPDLTIGSGILQETTVSSSKWFYLSAGDSVEVESDGGDILFHLNGYEDDAPTE